MFDDLDAHEGVVATLADRDIPIVWTAHNLTPHDKRPEVFDRVYSIWAQAADAVIHHSEWGEHRVRDRYSFRPDCLHRVIPHGHWAPLWDAHLVDRATAESRLDLSPCGLRIGLIGAPRREKRVIDFLTGVTAARRTDVQVVCWSLLPGETAPDDPRIPIAETYRTVDATTYATRLAACDMLALPFDPDGDMIATGTVFDAIAAGIPALVSSWPYLTEVLGDAGVRTGIAPDEVAATLDALDGETVATARAAVAELRAATEWSASAEATLALFEELFAG
jgi:glycosyltransferase involved in cell wall biosynthesis